jgi:hypothetical protein
MRTRFLTLLAFVVLAIPGLVHFGVVAQTALYPTETFAQVVIINPNAPADHKRNNFHTYGDGTLALTSWNDASTSSWDIFYWFRGALTSDAGAIAGGDMWIYGDLQVGAGPEVWPDSTTDVGAALNSALATTGYVKLAPTKGLDYYRSTVTIVVPAGATLEGSGGNSMGLSFTGTSTFGSTGGVKIKCAATVSPCVQVGQNVQGGKSTSLRDIYVGREGSLPAASTGYIGIQWMGGFNSRGFNVTSDNHAICFAWKTPPGTNDGLSFMGEQLYGNSCSDAYLWQDEWPETRITNSRFGDTNGTAANTYMRISCSRHDCTGAAASNGLEVVNSQFNSSGPPVGKLIELKDFGTAVEGSSGQDAELPTLSSVHAENFNVFMTSDNSVDVARGMKITNSSFYVNTDTFQLNAATSVDKWDISNSDFLDATGAATFTLNPSGNSLYNGSKRVITHLQITGGMIGMASHITGQGASNSMASIIGVSHGNTFTLDGRWANVSVIGGNWSGGNLIDNTNSADDVTINENNILKFHGNPGILHVANNAALLILNARYTSNVIRDAFSTTGDKGGATYAHSATACSAADNGYQVTAADGGCWINQSRELTPEMYGGGNGATGATNVAAFNAAMATGKSVICEGTYTITDRLTFAANGALGGNHNHDSCKLSITSAFNMSATGVLQMCPFGAIEPGGYVHELSIDFTQPDTNIKTSLTAYPPAITSFTSAIYPATGSQCGRWRARDLKIDKAWTGIDMRGNSGGVVINGLELSAFDKGIRLDGALDVTRINDLHWWPFGSGGGGMTTNQQTVFALSSTAFEVGRADGVYCNDCVMLGGLGLNFVNTGGGTAWFAMNGGGFDTHSGVLLTVDSTVQLNNVYFTPTLAGDYAINQSSGRLLLNNSTVYEVLTAPTNSGIRVSGGIFKASNNWIANGARNLSPIWQSGGITQIVNNEFARDANVNYTVGATIDVTAGRATIMGNRIEDKGTCGGGTCTGLFIHIASDEWHRVIGNVGVGWTNSFPTAVNGIYSLN